MRSGLALSWMLVAACSFSPPTASVPPPDVGSDADGPMPDACVTFSSVLDTCALPLGIPLDLSGQLEFNTDTGVLMGASGQIAVRSEVVTVSSVELRVLIATTVMLAPGTRLRATGVRGLAIAASDTITIGADARIEVGRGGAGYRSDCMSAQPGGNDTGGAAGGGGGGFGSPGGDGGNGDSDTGQSTGGTGGMAADIPTIPLGGCSGARGGHGDQGNTTGGDGGRGGGAIYLVSAEQIGIGDRGGVNASGEGGGGGKRISGDGDGGGGGGGSGGLILLEAPRIRSNGVLAANGGGGGEGSDDNNAGDEGDDGPFGPEQAEGGDGDAFYGGRGGNGGHRASPNGAKPMGTPFAGGGGGGGGVGFIIVRSPDAELNAGASPEPVLQQP